jgi:hypothetical protein
MQFLGEQVVLFITAYYLGVTLDTHLSWSVQFNQVEKEAGGRLGVLDCLLKKGSLRQKRAALGTGQPGGKEGS